MLAEDHEITARSSPTASLSADATSIPGSPHKASGAIRLASSLKHLC